MLTPDEFQRAIRRDERSRAKAEAEESLVSLVLERVLNGVWHATNTTRFQEIMTSGAILPEPMVADIDR